MFASAPSPRQLRASARRRQLTRAYRGAQLVSMVAFALFVSVANATADDLNPELGSEQPPAAQPAPEPVVVEQPVVNDAPAVDAPAAEPAPEPTPEPEPQPDAAPADTEPESEPEPVKTESAPAKVAPVIVQANKPIVAADNTASGTYCKAEGNGSWHPNPWNESVSNGEYNDNGVNANNVIGLNPNGTKNLDRVFTRDDANGRPSTFTGQELLDNGCVVPLAAPPTCAADEELVNNVCVKIDVCTNIAGNQTTVPTGNVSDNGICKVNELVGTSVQGCHARYVNFWGHLVLVGHDRVTLTLAEALAHASHADDAISAYSYFDATGTLVLVPQKGSSQWLCSLTPLPTPITCTDSEQIAIDTNLDGVVDRCVFKPLICIAGAPVDTNGNGNADLCVVLVPRIDCGVNNADGSRTLHWSYRNPTSHTVTVTGLRNIHSGGGQPSTFAPGTGGQFTTVVQPGGAHVWQLTGNTAWGFHSSGNGPLQTEPCFQDVCANLAGDQGVAPAGLVINNRSECVDAPPASCPDEQRAGDTDGDGVADTCGFVQAACSSDMVGIDTNGDGNPDTCVAPGSCVAGSTWTDANSNTLVDAGECSIVAGTSTEPTTPALDLGATGGAPDPDAADQQPIVDFNPLNDPEDIDEYNQVVAGMAVEPTAVRTDDGSLPFTGLGLDRLAILGGVLLVLGAATQAGTRRRRTARVSGS